MFESVFRRFGYVKVEGQLASEKLDEPVLVQCPDCEEQWKSADGQTLPLAAPEDVTTPKPKALVEPQAHRVVSDALAAAAAANDADDDNDEWEWQLAMARARAASADKPAPTAAAPRPAQPPAQPAAPAVDEEDWEWQLAMARARAKAEDERPKPIPRPPRRRPRGSEPPINQHAQSHTALPQRSQAQSHTALPQRPQAQSHTALTEHTDPDAQVRLRNAAKIDSPVSSLLQRQLERNQAHVGRSPRTTGVKAARLERARRRRSHATTVAAPRFDNAKRPKKALTDSAPLPRFTTSRANRS